MNLQGFVCTTCGKFYSSLPQGMICEDCTQQGILDVVYDYQAIAKEFHPTTLRLNPDSSMWRYLSLLPVKEKPKQGLHVGGTPLYSSQAFASQVGLKSLYIKDDGLNPTGSLKDRASIVACVKAIEEGKTILCCSSTGNAASSLAGNAAKLGLQTVIFVPKRIPIGKRTQLQLFGSHVIVVDGDYKAAFQCSKQAIETFGFYNRNAAINPFLVEGKKTVALEIAEQMQFQNIDWVVVSVGDGCTIAGVYKGFYDLFQLGLIKSIPKLLGVQASGCRPFVDAWEHQRDVQESEEQTLADSIAVGIPRNPKKAIRAIQESKGCFVSVSDEAILSTMAFLGKTEGLFVEPASAAGFAGLIEAFQKGIIRSEETVVVINTGNGLKDIENAKKAVSELDITPNDWESVKQLFHKEGIL